MEEPQGLELRAERDELRESLGRIGAWSFALETLTAAEEREAVAEIESFGYRAIWFPEAVESREVFSHASWILASTERALAVSAIANIWARDPTAMANGWRMLSDAYPGRFVLGVGVSHAGSVARRGGTYEQPYTAMRDYLDAMDRAPSSAPEPEVTPRLVLAALGPKMLELAAERSHGVHPYFVPVEHTAFARQRLGPGPVLAVEQTVVLRERPVRGPARRPRVRARLSADRELRAEPQAPGLDRRGRRRPGERRADRRRGRVGRRRSRGGARPAAPRRRRRPRVRPGGLRRRARPVPAAAARARARPPRAVGQRGRRRAWTASLRSSRRASRAIHLDDRPSIRSISSAVRIASTLSAASRLPIWRSAQETAFFT